MTEPLTPSNCDLRDFAFMPLDVARLRDSDLASNETPEACWSAVLLWAASWHQVPAASIPNDEKWIAKQAGYAQRGKVDRAWADVRPGALRGWIECADGRLYHPVVAEKAIDAWKAKLEQRWRTECGRIKKHNDRHHASVEKPSFEEWLSSGCPTGQTLFVPRDNEPGPKEVPNDTHSKGQGEGQGQGQGDLESTSAKASVDVVRSPRTRPPSLACPYDEVLALYHEILHENPRVAAFSPERKARLKKCWDLWATHEKGPYGAPPSKEGGLRFWRKFFESVAAEPRYMGKTPPREGYTDSFRADFDFLVGQKHIRIVERA